MARAKTLAAMSDREAMIAVCAYFKAEARGFVPGYEIEDWLAAEAEIGALAGKAKSEFTSKAKAKAKAKAKGKAVSAKLAAPMDKPGKRASRSKANPLAG